ncbi:hypothetical protein CU044_2137 [Streptomyces sp. L-9-10]|uniref:hypothetical protein n=1 Tax=Streptomyces sp. L-9-10 TaxID=1478131 RepID=UPI00101DC3D4|nr:hypothetical protein [Streptomyces sp. L-9-10]RYJ29396.1 hypothetical protein CU044_2137 [Streptomyces sp. L-9-10]
MPADLNPSTKPPLSVRLRSDWLRGILRVDLIRHHTLIGLVQHWGDNDAREDVITQLDALAEAVQSPREGELDALTEAVEDAAALDTAEIDISLSDALRLRNELDAVIGRLSRFNPQRITAVPSLPERRTA